MKALIYTGPKSLSYEDAPEPHAEADEVLVRVAAVGVCGSDLHAYLGHDSRRPAPLILGHEASGVVVGGPEDGRRVVINPLVTCGACPACLGGRSNLCADRQIISMAPRQGAFADLVRIPRRNLSPVPDGVDMTKAALAEPIATAWHGVKIAGRAGDRPLSECGALVFGGGAVGLSAALSLKAFGCRSIALAETNPMRREGVARTGVCAPYDPTTDRGPAESSIDVVIDCVGADATRRAASAAVRPGGVIVHIGLAQGAEGFDVRKITLQEVAVFGAYTYTPADFAGALAAMADGALGPLDWFEERPLAEGAGAFADLTAGRTAASKIILRPEGGA